MSRHHFFLLKDVTLAYCTYIPPLHMHISLLYTYILYIPPYSILYTCIHPSLLPPLHLHTSLLPPSSTPVYIPLHSLLYPCIQPSLLPHPTTSLTNAFLPPQSLPCPWRHPSSIPPSPLHTSLPIPSPPYPSVSSNPPSTTFPSRLSFKDMDTLLSPSRPQCCRPLNLLRTYRYLVLVKYKHYRLVPFRLWHSPRFWHFLQSPTPPPPSTFIFSRNTFYSHHSCPPSPSNT